MNDFDEKLRILDKVTKEIRQILVYGSLKKKIPEIRCKLSEMEKIIAYCQKYIDYLEKTSLQEERPINRS